MMRISAEEIPELLHNQFFVLIAGATLGFALGAPAFLISFPISRLLAVAYGPLVLLFLVLALVSASSDRPRQIVVKALRPVWARRWLRVLAAALWLGFAFLFLWIYRFAFGETRLESYLALFGFGLWATAGLALVLGTEPLQVRVLSAPRWGRWLALLVVVGWIGFGFYLWGENLHAHWGVLDDHELLHLIGSGNYLAWSDIPGRLVTNPEVLPFAGTRFRPIFWIGWALEGALWGDQPLLWYFARTGIFILACLVCYRLLVPLLGALNSALLILVLATFSFWSDISTRLGPAENYALLGLTGYALAYVALVRHYRADAPSPDRWVSAYWILLGASAVFTMGAKENFVWLLLPNAALFGYLLLKRRRSISGMTVLVVSTAFGFLSLAAVWFTNTMRGADQYGNSAVLSDRLGNTLEAFQRNVVGLPALAAFGGLLVVLSIGAIVLYRTGDRAGLVRLGRACGAAGLVALGLAAVYVSQLYFYNGDLPANSRYDFPASLIPAFVGLVGIVLILLTVHLTVKQPYYDALAALTLTVMLGSVIVVNGFSKARDASHANFERTWQFRAALATIESAAITDPHAALVLDTHSGWDYEASLAVVRFLRRAQIANPIFIRYMGTEHLDSKIPLQKMLAQELSDIAQGTRPSEYYAPFRNFGGAPCFGISFSGESAPPCVPLTRIWQ